MAIGLSRAGYLGVLAAWIGFTVPSAIIMVVFAYGISSFGDAGGAVGCTV
jgi:chromate transporter